MKDFMNIFTTAPGNEITVYFKDGSEADYTTNILELLKADPEVNAITDAETGEIIFFR